jgi:outer membrane protein assembly factor BamB
LLAAGGNGILHTISLNVEINRETRVPSVESPTTEQYIAKPLTGEKDAATIYSAYAVYDDIVYIATQGGVLQAIDINSLEAVWALELGQETDAAISIDPDASGTVSIYTASRPDMNGKSHVRRVDALTGAIDWDIEINGAVSASMLIGTDSLSGLVYVAAEEPSALYALNKADGQLVWHHPLQASRASAPIALYSKDGEGYVVQGDEGAVYLLDGLSGEAFSSVMLEGNVVGSPSAFNNMIAIATSAGKLYGIQVK